jgi:ABC-type tungstate transport system substrate-binding protein
MRERWAGCSYWYTPAAMIVAQTILGVAIVLALSREVIEQLHNEYAERFRSLCVRPHRAIQALLWEARYSLLKVARAFRGRAIKKVRVAMIVGGNINHIDAGEDQNPQVNRPLRNTAGLEIKHGDCAR